MLLFEKGRGMRSSGTNFLFWFGMICYGTVKIRSLILIASDDVRIPPTLHPPGETSTPHLPPSTLQALPHYVCVGRRQGPVSVCDLLHSVLCHYCGVCSGVSARAQVPVSVSPWRQPGGGQTHVLPCVCVFVVHSGTYVHVCSASLRPTRQPLSCRS